MNLRHKASAFLFTLLAGFLAAGFTAPQPQEDTKDKLDKSLLWKIEGPDIQTSYLYGTIHMLSQEDFELGDIVEETFGMAEQLVLELDMDDPGMQMAMLQHISMKDGQTLDKLLSEEDYKLLDERLKAAVGAGIQPFNSWMPYLVSTLLLQEVLGESPASFEMTFITMAKNAEIEILGLETIEEQLNIFHAMPYEEQVDILTSYLHDPSEMAGEFDGIIDLYKAQDIEGLRNLMNEETDTNLPADLLLDRRNENWVPNIIKYAADKTSFIAVGAGHLAGDKGVITLLREAGYTVTPIN